MSKVNCWEAKQCGRQPQGAKVQEFGVCPASQEQRANGINGGVNGGRACWAIAGTFCGGKVQGAFAAKLDNCMSCAFYTSVVSEQWPDYHGTVEILARLGVK